MFSALPQRLRTSFVRYAHAQALVALKQPLRAIRQLRLAVQESPEFVDAWFELARLLEADWTSPASAPGWTTTGRKANCVCGDA